MLNYEELAQSQIEQLDANSVAEEMTLHEYRDYLFELRDQIMARINLLNAEIEVDI